MRKVLLAAVAIVLVLLVASQVIAPRVISGEVEKRLTQDGGTAHVTITAWPAATLVGGRGQSIEISGDDLVYDLDERKERPFERLDGFGDVRVDLRDLDAGAVQLTTFTLTREGRDEPYALTMRGTSTPRDLASELGTATGGALGGLLGGLASGVLPDGGVGTVPLRMDATVTSVDGRPRVDRARASVAGVPAGPLTEVVLRAVIERL
jgi:hypothetical protein